MLTRLQNMFKKISQVNHAILAAKIEITDDTKNMEQLQNGLKEKHNGNKEWQKLKQLKHRVNRKTQVLNQLLEKGQKLESNWEQICILLDDLSTDSI